MSHFDLRIEFVYSVVVLTIPTAPQILTALTENSTLVSGIRFGRTYISFTLFTVVLVASYISWISESAITPLLSDGAVHEKVILV